MRTYISFDWAIKKLFRDKANFDVLEGFLSELLEFQVKIQEVLESESNKETVLDKYDRVDILVKSDQDELMLIEVQYDSEYENMSDLDKQIYQRRIENRRIEMSVLETAEMEGFDRGVKETAKNLKNMGLPTQEISKATGLSISEIEKL